MVARFKLSIKLLVVFALIFSVNFVSGNKSVKADDTIYTYLPLVGNNSCTGCYSAADISFTHYGPFGGTVTALAALASQPNIIYAGSWGSGVFKSVDGGADWSSANKGLAALYIYSLAIDPEVPSTIFAGAYEGGIYKSTDSGATWNAVNTGLNSSATVYALAINPKNSNIIFAGMRVAGLETTLQTSYCTAPIYDYGGGTFRSTDGGNSWTQVDGGQACGYVYGLAIDPANTNNVYVATHEKGVLKSTNGGSSFQYSNQGLTDLDTRSIVIDPVYTNEIYVSTWHGTAVAISHDAGSDWITDNTGIAGDHVIKLGIDSTLRSDSCPVLYALTYGAGTGVAKSTDCGSQWTNVGSSSFSTYIYDLAVLPGNGIYYGTTSKGIYKSNTAGDQNSWVLMNNGLANTNIDALVYDPENPTTFYVGTSANGIFKSTNSGVTWTAINSGLPNNGGTYTGILKIAVDPTHSNILYVGTDGGGVYKSTNAGSSWSSSSSGLPTTSSSSETEGSTGSNYPNSIPTDPLYFETNASNNTESQKSSLGNQSFAALAINPSNTSILYAGSGKGAFISTNSGSSWTADGLAGIPVFSVAIDPSTSTTLYAGTSAGIYKTTNSGTTWNLIGASGNLVDDIEIDPTNSANVYAASQGGGIFKSVDSGANWTSSNNDLENLTVYSISIDPSKTSILFAGTADGLYRSDDGGTSWLSVGLDNSVRFADPVVTKPDTADTVFMGSNGGTLMVTFTTK